MKKSISILIMCFLISVSGHTVMAQESKPVKLSVSYTFKGIVEGYDHQNKIEVYIDGTLAGTSEVKKESEKNSVTITTSKGKHEVKVINYAFYEGNWEEHTIANNYSQDCIYTEMMNLHKKSNKLVLLFDIDNGTKRVK